MKYVVWTLQVLLAISMVGSGVSKLATSREELQTRMGWAEDFTQTQIRLIGVAEAAGGIGLILPAATGIAPILTPLAATGITAIMLGASYTHLRRDEPFIGPLVFVAAALVIAVFWFRKLRRPRTSV